MKLINIGLLVVAITFNMGFTKYTLPTESELSKQPKYLASLLDTSVKTEVETTKFIPYTAGKIIDGFLQNGFVIADNNDATKQYITLNEEENSDIAIKIYAKSQMDNVNGIFILINLNNYTANNDSDKIKRPLNEEVFNNIKKSLPSLDCNNNIDFLRSGFVCPNKYEVLYTINSDNFDGVRKFFGFEKRSELLISIIPTSKN